MVFKSTLVLAELFPALITLEPLSYFVRNLELRYTTVVFGFDKLSWILCKKISFTVDAEVSFDFLDWERFATLVPFGFVAIHVKLRVDTKRV